VSRLLTPAIALVLLGNSPCEPTYPGEPVGSFDVVGRLEANSCGSTAVPALDPLTFFVEVRREGGQAFWRRPEAPLVSGTVTEAGGYRFRHRSSILAIEADPAQGNAGCRLEQVETVEVTLDGLASSPADGGRDGGGSDGGGSDGGGSGAADASGSPGDAGPAASLTGVNRVELAPSSGSACGALLGAQGGPFAALPCEVEYALEGTSRPPF
jgi:hypothetical protein